MTKLVKRTDSLLKFLEFSKKLKKKINFVPTMGNLHNGHLSLVKSAKKKSGLCLVSIFINPLQFNERNDYKKYPRTLKEDLFLLNGLNVDIVFIPELDFVSPNLSNVHVSEISNVLCGIDRPGHFKGVATVMKKFLTLINPDTLFLGEKDYQQTMLIKKLIKDFHFKTKVIILPTVRDEEGLALSSRNKLINKKKSEMKVIFNILTKISEEILKRGLELSGIDFFKRKMLDSGIQKVNYLEVLNEISFKKIDKKPCVARIFVSVNIDDVRLIDNIKLKRKIRLVNRKLVVC